MTTHHREHHALIANWRKARSSNPSDHCVDSGSYGGQVGYRDTAQAGLPAADRPILLFTRPANGRFLAAVAQGTLTC